MTYGTAKTFKSAKGLCKFISKHAVDEEKLESGCIVEYSVRKCDIPVEGPRSSFQKKVPDSELNLHKTIKEPEEEQEAETISV